MARPIERIERDIVELEKAIGAIAQQLQNGYGTYLEILGQAVRQQLILASYHICTQGYPENFLGLSLNQRQKLQQTMRKLGKSAAQDMQALINDDEEFEEAQNELEEIEKDFEEEQTEEKLDFEDDLQEIAQELELKSEDLPEIPQELDIEDEESLANALAQAASSGSLPQDVKIASFSSVSGSPPTFSTPSPPSKDWKNWFNPNTSNPMELAAWQKNLERAIAYILKSLSRDGNRLLQKTAILPKKLPEPILEAAVASSEASTEMMPGPPNLLNLVVGIEGEKQEAENLTKVMALNLRLIEIEFADIKLSSERKQIRNILNHLGKLGREYQQKQRERSIANAEAAWRSSWYED